MLENVDALRDEAVLDEQLGEADGPGRGTSPRRFASSASAAAAGRSPVFKRSVSQYEQSLGRLLELGESRLRQLQRTPIVSLLRLRAGESDPGGCVLRVELENPPEDGNGPLALPLERVDLRQVQLGADEARLQPDGFLEQLGALSEPVLLKANGAQHRTGRGSRLGIGERQLGLLVGFLEPTFLDQGRRLLECLVRLVGESGPPARER